MICNESRKGEKISIIQCPDCKGRGLTNNDQEGCELCQRRGKLIVLSIPQYEAMKRESAPRDEVDRVTKENRELRRAIKEIYTRFDLYMDPDDEPEEY